MKEGVTDRGRTYYYFTPPHHSGFNTSEIMKYVNIPLWSDSEIKLRLTQFFNGNQCKYKSKMEQYH